MEYIKLKKSELAELLEWAYHGVECDRLTAEITGDDFMQKENEEMVKEWNTYKDRAKCEDDEKYSKKNIFEVNRIIQDGKNIGIERRMDEFVLQDEFNISDSQIDYDVREMYSKLCMIARLDDYEIEEINLLLDKFIENRM